MCRCPDYNPLASSYAPPWRPTGTASTNADDKGGLRIRSFQLRLISTAGPLQYLPGTITLVYFPPSSASGIEINGCKSRPGAPAFLSLYRVQQSAHKGAAEFACTDRVCAPGGARFEAYVGDDKVVSGVIRRKLQECGEEDGSGGWDDWEMECRSEAAACRGVSGVEVTVVGERGVVLREKVEVVPKRPRGKSGPRRGGGCGEGRRFCSRLEGIPEEQGESEEEVGERDSSDTDTTSSSGSSSSCSCSFCGESGGEEEDWEMVTGSEGSVEAEEEVEAEVEGVRWAVDVGIWVMCIGVGLLLSKASTASALNRRWRSKGFLLFR